MNQLSKKRLLIAIIFVLSVLSASLYLRRELQIDSCLDSGGRWDYEQSVCDK